MRELRNVGFWLSILLLLLFQEYNLVIKKKRMGIWLRVSIIYHEEKQICYYCRVEENCVKITPRLSDLSFLTYILD